jgi:hypothetical protein
VRAAGLTPGVGDGDTAEQGQHEALQHRRTVVQPRQAVGYIEQERRPTAPAPTPIGAEQPLAHRIPLAAMALAIDVAMRDEMRALVTAATAKAIGMDIQFKRDLMQRVDVAEEDRNGQVRSPRGGDRSDNEG